MEIISINVGQAEPIIVQEKERTSGIFKHPVKESVFVRWEGLVGDLSVAKEVHGGVDRAVYIFNNKAYDFWRQYLPEEMCQPGCFGENVNLAHWNEDDIFIGDIFNLGEVQLQATMPRIPCVIFAARIGRSDAQDLLHQSRQAGVLFRVLKEGQIKIGDKFSRVERSRHQLSLPNFLAKVRDRKVTKQDCDLFCSIPEIPKQFRERVRGWVID